MRVEIADIAFDNVTMGEAVVRIMQMVHKSEGPCHVCTGNLDHLRMLHRDSEFRAVYDSAAMVLADGAPVVWLSRLSPDGPLKERVTGSDLFWELARASDRTGVRLFFLGGQPGAAEQAADVLRERYPKAQICGCYCPSFETFATDEEQARIRAAIREAEPDILLVGLGAPKQEKWIARNKSCLGVPVSIGVGGSFEMAAGIVRRAPLWMQRAGMEWVFRLLQEPDRLWRRYLLGDLPFLILATHRTLRARRMRREAAPNSQARDNG